MDTTAATVAQQPSMFSMLLPFIMMIGVFWLLIIRPQQKQKKLMQQMLENLKVGDNVVTSSGIIGKIANMNNEKGTVTIKVDENTNTKMIFQKSAVVNVISGDVENA